MAVVCQGSCWNIADMIRGPHSEYCFLFPSINDVSKNLMTRQHRAYFIRGYHNKKAQQRSWHTTKCNML